MTKIKVHKPKMSSFCDPQTGEFDIQGFDMAMDAYEQFFEEYRKKGLVDEGSVFEDESGNDLH
jgi:hypothetical protein